VAHLPVLFAKPFPRLIHPTVKPAIALAEKKRVQLLVNFSAWHFSPSVKSEASTKYKRFSR
jgi:hypothetical protein